MPTMVHCKSSVKSAYKRNRFLCSEFRPLIFTFFFTSMVKLELNMRESELMKRGLHELLVYSLNKILGEDIDKSIHKTLFCIIVF
mmetsp:Transcript_15268/g.29821  ORF Transcript_15268/g.29821 Transcript_15268/m.29821 type:complete len:85 (-) Transcript_15268:6-260(-)